jgi:hypothetical protein
VRCRDKSGIEEFGARIALMGLLTLAAMVSAGQTNRANGPFFTVIASSSDLTRLRPEIVREIDDPATGDRWLLERDAQHPGGPGRMALIGHENASATSVIVSVKSWRGMLETGSAPVLIHAGDHLIVEEHNRMVDAVFEAVALAPAREGESFRVRLSIVGRVVKVIAIAPGRAILALDSGVRP